MHAAIFRMAMFLALAALGVSAAAAQRRIRTACGCTWLMKRRSRWLVCRSNIRAGPTA